MTPDAIVSKVFVCSKIPQTKEAREGEKKNNKKNLERVKFSSCDGGKEVKLVRKGKDTNNQNTFVFILMPLRLFFYYY